MTRRSFYMKRKWLAVILSAAMLFPTAAGLVSCTKQGATDTPPAKISYSSVEALYKQAIRENPLDQKYLDMIESLDNYVIKRFRVAFGNRIMKHLKVFVPVYVACGGDVVEGIDHMLATKVFRKFEMLNLALIRDEIKGLINYLNTLFGKDKMKSCIEFLDRLQRS